MRGVFGPIVETGEKLQRYLGPHGCLVDEPRLRVGWDVHKVYPVEYEALDLQVGFPFPDAFMVERIVCAGQVGVTLAATFKVALYDNARAKMSTFIQYLILLGVKVHNERIKEGTSVKVRR